MLQNIKHSLLNTEQNIRSEEIRLKEHIEDAQMLLTYAAEKGMQIEESVASDIINSRYHLKANNLDQEQEIKFWVAFNELSKKIQPVNIDSIKGTRGHRKTSFSFKPLVYFFNSNKSEAAHTVIVYQRWTLFALFVLLFVQIYWFVGSIIITQVTQELEFDDEITALTILVNNAKEKDYAEIGKLAGQIRKDYENKIKNNDSAKEIYYDRLKSWRNTIFTSWMFNDLAEKNEEYIIKGYIEARQSAQLILQPIQQYILPLLYGWIGALAYVLRRINEEIAKITYTDQSKEHYRLRVQLGALSGLAVGWFLSVDPATSPSFSFGNLSPLALSFLAGYSVELLFSAADKIVEAFSGQSAYRSTP